MSYPPERHVLRDLGLALERSPGAPDRAILPVVPEIRDGAKRVRLGVLATLVDVVGAGVALRKIAPDWLATADLSVHARDVVPIGPLAGEARALRSGRTTTVVEVRLFDEGAARREVAIATMSFVRIVRPDATRSLETPTEAEVASRFEFALSDSGLTRPYPEALGVRVLDASRGELELARMDYTINSFGSLQGGTVASVAELAGEVAARAAGHEGGVSSDVAVHYLAQGPHGPYRTVAELLRVRPSVARVEVHDAGAGELMAVAMVGVLDPQPSHARAAGPGLN
jgi:acyl-coenzyme A thioesterase PaaI-like protein